MPKPQPEPTPKPQSEPTPKPQPGPTPKPEPGHTPRPGYGWQMRDARVKPGLISLQRLRENESPWSSVVPARVSRA
jgi:outer membrane biosynthesis protein TonB